jgi:hypothetical protein
VIQYLPSKCEALNPNLSTAKKKLELELPYDSTIQLLCIYPKEMNDQKVEEKSATHTSPMFFAACPQ